MQSQTSEEQFLLEIEALRREIEVLKQEKGDLEILLEMTTEHSDTVEAELQQEAEAAVRESEHRLAQFLEAVPVGVFVVDGGGKTYYANQAAQQILGHAIPEQPQQPPVLVERFPDTYQAHLSGSQKPYPATQQPIARALKGETSTTDDMEIRRGDRTIPLEVWATPIFNEKNEVIYAIAAFQDITERKRAEDALRIAEANYRSIFENASEGIYQISPEGRYLNANLAIARIYGYESPEALINSVTALQHQVYVDPTDRQRFQEALEKDHEIKNFEYQAYHRDGRKLWLLESARAVCDRTGTLLYYEGMCIDITQRKQQEEDLRQRVQQLQIQVDDAKRRQQVSEIVETDYFRQLQAEARLFRERHSNT